MSRHLGTISAIALCLAAPQLVLATTYTREEAVKIALEKSSDVKTAEEELVSANSQVDAGYGNALPSIDLSATVMRIFGLDDVDMDDLSMTEELIAKGKSMGLDDPSPWDAMAFGAINGVVNGMKAQAYRWQSSVDLTATQILYAQGKVGTGIQIAKTYKHIKEVSLDNAKANVRYDVENAFDQLIFLDSTMVILQESKNLLQENLNFVEQSLKSGMATELDLIRIQLSMDQLNSKINNMEKSRVLARNALLNTMGMDWETDVQFQGELRDPTDGYTFPDTSMANVKKRRKELAMLEESEKIQSKLIDIEKGDYRPTVVLIGGLKYANNQNSIKDWDAPDWDKNINKYIALNATMNLFNGMQTREKVTQAKSSLRSTQIQKESAERGFRLQIESCMNDLNDAEQQLGIKKRSVELAQKNQILTEASYNVGKETQLNLLESTMKLRNAKLNYMEAVLNWNNAYNALLQATGEY